MLAGLELCVERTVGFVLGSRWDTLLLRDFRAPHHRTVMQELITISFSHYCEKARWGLDLVGKPYRERGHLPIFHFLPVALATRGAADKASDAVSTQHSTPVLITEEGPRICDSTRILRHLCETEALTLYRAPDSLALDEQFSRELGPHTRRFGYHFMLDDAALIRNLFWKVGNRPEAVTSILLRPLYARVMRKALNINPKSAQRSKQRVLEVVEGVNERLADGRSHLCGDEFSGADLSFAALFAPALMLTQDEGYGSPFPHMDQAGGAVRDFALRMRDTAAGQFALRVYQEHRAPSAAVD